MSESSSPDITPSAYKTDRRRLLKKGLTETFEGVAKGTLIGNSVISTVDTTLKKIDATPPNPQASRDIQEASLKTGLVATVGADIINKENPLVLSRRKALKAALVGALNRLNQEKKK